jgi:hypothetical protein
LRPALACHRFSGGIGENVDIELLEAMIFVLGPRGVNQIRPAIARERHHFRNIRASRIGVRAYLDLLLHARDHSRWFGGIHTARVAFDDTAMKDRK